MGEYVIPKNLRNEKDAYIFSFANRTKQNLKFIKEIAEREKREGKKGKDTTVYEVTQLINSMIGLVTFPKEAFYEKALGKGFGQYASEYLIELVKKVKKKPIEFDYHNTYFHYCGKEQYLGKNWSSYSKNKFEKLDVLTFIRHFRNALSHEKLSVYLYNIEGNEEIKGFIFEDESEINLVDIGNKYIKKRGGQSTKYIQKFKIKLTVEQIEAIAIDICDMLLAVARDTYGISESIEEFY